MKKSIILALILLLTAALLCSCAAKADVPPVNTGSTSQEPSQDTTKPGTDDPGPEKPGIKEIIDIVERDNLSTAEALEGFFSDESYDYMYPSIRSEYVRVYYTDGSEETVAEALKGGRIEISDLDRFGIHYYKKSGFESFKIKSFSLCWNVNADSSYDSESGVLIKQKNSAMTEEQIKSLTTTLTLSEEELAQIKNLISNLEIETYPDSVSEPGKPNSIPFETLILTVKTDTRVKTVTVKDGFSQDKREDTAEGRLLAVCDKIKEIIYASEKWQALPEYAVLYE